MLNSIEQSLAQASHQADVTNAVEQKAMELLDADLRALLESLIPERRTMLKAAFDVQALRLLKKLCDSNDGRKKGCNG